MMIAFKLKDDIVELTVRDIDTYEGEPALASLLSMRSDKLILL